MLSPRFISLLVFLIRKGHTQMGWPSVKKILHVVGRWDQPLEKQQGLQKLRCSAAAY
jgi:hypothetical protein